MSWQDRPYSGEGGGPELRINFRRPGTAVTWLIVANVIVFLLQEINGHQLDPVFGLRYAGLRKFYFWQPLTYMFLHHDGAHLFFNMLGLFFFGREFERNFGTRRFLEFYTICGLVGGLAYGVLGAITPRFAFNPVVGASGAIFGLLMAAVIFWPGFQIILLIFPVPVRVAALLYVAFRAYEALTGSLSNVGGELCHVAGALASLGVFYYWGIMPHVKIGGGRGFTVLPGSGPRVSRGDGAWARRQKQLAEEQAEVDRILQKVHDEGLNSLTRREKKTLSRATQRQREREQDLHRVDRM